MAARLYVLHVRVMCSMGGVGELTVKWRLVSLGRKCCFRLSPVSVTNPQT